MGNPTGTGIWEHEGVQILITLGGGFVAQIDDMELSDDTLAGIERQISKATRATVKKREVNLPVVLLVTSNSIVLGDKGSAKIVKATITGLNRTTREFTFAEADVTKALKGGYMQARITARYILPDTPANVALLERKIRADAEMREVVLLTDRQCVAVPGHGRMQVDEYDKVLDRVVETYAKNAEWDGGE